ncbi:MAG: galactokinase [Clostridia bacterium]|nr:galactokinase [Clostridia bacterium]
MNISELIQKLQNGGADNLLAELYGKENLAAQRDRYIAAVYEFEKMYGERDDVGIYSVSGRSELSGNHTDHNHGCVIAASIDLDIIAVAAKTDENIIRLKSEGFEEDIVDFSYYSVPKETKFGTSESLIAGMCQGFLKDGYKIGGFCAYTTSSVLKGSGLSSSAAFEDMIGNILNHMYNDGNISNVEIAKLAQYAENVFFGKPCGLMDQVACAAGGIVAIDFEDTSSPVIDIIAVDMQDYKLCIVNTGGNHADLTDDYASVPAEMKAIASYFGKPYLREVEEKDVLDNVAALREKFGDRAVLRALHFFAENRRVVLQKRALLEGDIQGFFRQVLESGRSSFCYLQNVYTTKNVSEQGLSLALCLAERYLADKNGAWRVHGGGFAGTIQSFVREKDTEGYRAMMDAAFGEGACIVLRIRPHGAVRVL